MEREIAHPDPNGLATAPARDVRRTMSSNFAGFIVIFTGSLFFARNLGNPSVASYFGVLHSAVLLALILDVVFPSRSLWRVSALLTFAGAMAFCGAVVVHYSFTLSQFHIWHSYWAMRGVTEIAVSSCLFTALSLGISYLITKTGG